MSIRTEMLCNRKTRRILVNASEIFPKTFPERVLSLADVNGRAAMAGDAVNQTRGQAEAHKQLSDGRFYECLDHDPVKEYQQVIKSAIKQMIEANELHVFIFYQISTRRMTLEDQLFQHVITQPITLGLT